MLIRVCFVLLSLLVVSIHPSSLYAKKKQPKLDLTSLKSDSVNADVKKIKKDAVVGKGLFTTYFNDKTGKLYFEIPDSAYARMFLLGSRVTSTSDDQDFAAGQMNTRPFLICFSTDGRNVYMHEVQTLNVVRPGDAIESSFERNNMNPVLKGFKIAARDKNCNYIDVTSFFSANEKCISPIKDSGPLGKLLGSDSKLKGTFQSEASGISFVKTFERNIEIESLLTYQLTGAVAKPYSVRLRRSIVALPDTEMPMRVQDNRVGYFYVDRSVFSSESDRIDQRTYIHRWRLEPKPEDRDRYFRGELVEPQKPIVFYVDSAFPEKWRQTIKDGIEIWNRAFEKAGFCHVVKALDYPKNDPLFDPDNLNYNCFRYVTTSTANAMGPSYVDPRTGEIIAADVFWYHNIVSLLHHWRFIQTGAVDKRVRSLKFSDDVMCESMKYAASHEIGHTLGLMHNMGASYSFPVEQLRNPQFTQQYGTTPSIMDYARNNYVAQPGDMERGVKLTPPELGVYDQYAIAWGYRLIKGANTPDDEKATLDKWIAEHAGDPMYEFGAQQMFSTVDPTDQTEDLGDDHIKASNYGISNLKILMQHFDEWVKEPGERYDNVENVYREIAKQYGRYVKHVMPYIGGIRFEEIRQGDNKTTGKHYISKAQQKQAMLWLLQQARTYDDWLTPTRLINILEIDKTVNEKLRSQIVSSLMNGAALFRIKEGGEANPKNNYQLVDYLDDLTAALFIAPKGGRLSDVEQHLQSSAVSHMLTASGLQGSSASSSSSSSSFSWDESLSDGSFCGYTQDFVRINFGVSALSKSQLGAIMTGRLKRVLQKYRQYRNTATGSTRDFYDYEILLIERALSVNQ